MTQSSQRVGGLHRGKVVGSLVGAAIPFDTYAGRARLES